MEINNTNNVRTITASASKKLSAQLCQEMGITNIEIEYTPQEYEYLVTYELFNRHISPLLFMKNPKVPTCKMTTVIEAKWREFIELKEQFMQSKSNDSVSTIGSMQDEAGMSNERTCVRSEAEKRFAKYSDRTKMYLTEMLLDLFAGKFK